MRTTNQIIVAVKENQPASSEEMRLAIAALAAIRYFDNRHLNDLIYSIGEGNESERQMRSVLAKRHLESMFKALKTPPDKWLGPHDTPGTPEHDAGMRLATSMCKAAGVWRDD